MSDSNLIYKISLGKTSKGEKGAIIDIIDNSQQDKKPKGSIFIHAGADGKLGTADDTIKTEGDVPTLNKNTLEKCLNDIKNADESAFDANKEIDRNAAEIKTTADMFSLEGIETGEELTNALEGKDQDKLKAKKDEKESFETAQLLRMRFNEEEAAYITDALNNADVSDDDKAKIMKILTSINVYDHEADKKRKEAVALAFKAIPVNKYEAWSAIKYLKKQLNGWINDDEHGFHPNFTNKITPHKIIFVWK